MIDLELFFAEKPTVPDWFKTHPIFQEVKQAHKIFPSIGLPNFTVDSNLDNTTTSSLITNLCSDMNAYLVQSKHTFTHLVGAAPIAVPSVKAKLKSKANKVAPILKLIDQFQAQLSKPKVFISKFAARQGLYIQSDIIDPDGGFFGKEGESLFKVYNKLVDFCQKHYNHKMFPLDSMAAFKEYSASNVNGSVKIVFSSDGIEGAWDILTMSQRGISSCQSWNGQYKICTIGSVLDPFTAIIYLTAGTPTEFGTKMIRRCVVRFAVDRVMKRPTIYLEYMYPGEHAPAMKAFKEAIRSKIGDKFPIVSMHSVSSERFYVPYDKMSEALLKHSTPANVNYRGSHNYNGIFPYRDTFMEYKLKAGGGAQDLLIDQSKTARSNQLGQILRDTTNISDFYIEMAKKVICDETFSKVEAASCKDVNDYLRKSCIKFYANKQSIRKEMIAKIAAEMKTHKDKSIFIPGTGEVFESVMEKAKRITKAKKAVAAPAPIVKKPTPTNTIETSIDQHIVPTISEMFKKTWSDIIVSDTLKAKTKVRKPRVKRAG
jgi:hypothetical protein